ncbi:glycosyltransferase family 2 protein [candidate division TA06 bacterium]|nr:glycosyltransferase family 2 protein [candidate division TA06 bacterium]
MISALIIAKDEKNNIGPCLDSLQGFAGEIIVVVDSSSTDETEQISRNKGARVLVKEWQGFGATKNWGLQQASGDLILWIDADERMTPELAKEITTTIQSNRNFSALAFPRKAYFLGRWIKHCGWYPGYVTRLFKKEKARFNDKQVHEMLVVDGKVIKLKEALLHYTDPDLAHYLLKFNKYTRLAAEQMNKSGSRFKLSGVILKPLIVFVKMYIIKLGFLDGMEGFILSVLSAHYSFVKNIRLWEIKRHQGNMPRANETIDGNKQ